MYVSEICAEGIFAPFPWWLKNVKSRSKVALFSNERHFAIRFPKKRTITFFWSKLSKLHKNDPILHVATTFSLNKGNKNKPWTHSAPLKWQKSTTRFHYWNSHIKAISDGFHVAMHAVQWVYRKLSRVFFFFFFFFNVQVPIDSAL